MISKMAMEDIEALRGEGITVTPEEAIRLNAFGLKVERNTESSEFYAMPRVSVLGDVTFHEPTIGSELWLNRVGKTFDLDDVETFMQLRAYSLSRPHDQLAPPEDKENLKKAVCDFVSGKLAGYTVQQVQNAVSYAVLGNDPSKCEARPLSSIKKEKAEEEEARDDEDYCYEIGLLRQGVMYRLGSAEQIRKMTTSELEMLVEYELYMKFGSERKKSQHEKNLVDYYGVLDEIRGAHNEAHT